MLGSMVEFKGDFIFVREIELVRDGVFVILFKIVGRIKVRSLERICFFREIIVKFFDFGVIWGFS